MKKRVLIAFGVLLLMVLATLVLWQGSLDFGRYGPASPVEAYLLWSTSTLVFLLTVTLGFYLARALVKVYIARRQGVEGSRIRTKLVMGALALSTLPSLFLVAFDVEVLNRTLDKWFASPAQEAKINLIQVATSLRGETQRRLDAQARWIAMRGKAIDYKFADCPDLGVDRVLIQNGKSRFEVCPGPAPGPLTVQGATALDGGRSLIVEGRMPVDLAAKEKQIEKDLGVFETFRGRKDDFRRAYVLLIVLITLFLVFVATWTGLFMARQISVPISALLKGVAEVRAGNLKYRVTTKAIDELATMVRAFNEMTQTLETNERELERRRRFAEAILENVPAGVMLLAPDGRILRINRALAAIFPRRNADGWLRLEDIFSAEDTAEIRYLLNRAKRTGLGARSADLKVDDRHLSITVTALEGRADAGFVMVIEDTTEVLRAQKAEAWGEVARRIAHELRNPLTPIALSADRLLRLTERRQLDPDSARVVQSCASLITREVEGVRALVDEFASIARFPAAQLRPADLNGIVEGSLQVFEGRLQGVTIDCDLAEGLPEILVDPEQIRRVVVNLIDNAAEAMDEQPYRHLYIGTRLLSPDSLELVVADTGIGIRAEDREKLFLPYFSTKGRGTGLGLAIVSHVLSEHEATIRVEDNKPAGARFVVEFPVRIAVEAPTP